MSWVNRIVAVCLLAAAWLLLPYTEKFPGSAADFPRLVLYAIMGLSVLLFARSFLPALVPLGSDERDFSRVARPLLTLAATVTAIIAMRAVGFFPAIAGLGLALIVTLGIRQPKGFIATYIGLMGAVYLIFQVALGVPLGATRLWGG